ncbi:MAG: TetR/AcrR family transcriptional regulator [Cocleimonas sp.]|nr:TetR/AcrR family transcriptional regulator [Cocleimonas sp.]
MNSNKKIKGEPWWHLWKCRRCSGQGRGEETRQILLQAAFDEIHKVGFQAASLSKILKDTGITKGALYHHFNNKLELGHAVLDEVVLVFFEQVWLKPLEQTDDPITTLQEILKRSGDEMTEEDARLGCPLNNLAQEMSPIDEGFRSRTVAIYDAWREVIEAALERGKLAGNICDDTDARRIAILFVATLEGCMGLSKSTQSLSLLMECGQGLIAQLEMFREK